MDKINNFFRLSLLLGTVLYCTIYLYYLYLCEYLQVYIIGMYKYSIMYNILSYMCIYDNIRYCATFRMCIILYYISSFNIRHGITVQN